jgi:polysaccharide biosynthesis transport protein
MFEAPRQIQSAAAGGANVAVDFPPDAGLDVRRLLAALWRGKATILWTTAASLLIAVMFVLLVPHRYTAVTQILIDPTDLHAVGNELTPTNQANEATVLQVESQVRVLTSDSVLRRVVKAEALDNDPEFAGQAAREGTDSAAAALNALKRSIQVKRAERTYVVDVSVTTREAAKSARIANAIADAYLQEQTDVRSDAARQISQSLSSRLAELKDRVRAAEDRVEAFKQRNNILGGGGVGGQLVNEQQLTEMNNQLSAARARTAAAKARLDQVQQVQLSRNEFGGFPEAVQSQTITALRSQYAEVMRREAEQMTSLGARHPAVIEIQAEAERLRHMIDDEVHRLAVSARTEYEGARANEGTIAANLEKLKSNAVTTNEAMVTLRELERDVQANRAVYEAFLVRARETGEQERLDTKNIRVISRADTPLRRSFPPSNLLLAVGALLFGVIAGSGIVITRETYGGAANSERDFDDFGRDFESDSERPHARAPRALRGRLGDAIRGFWPAVGRPSAIPVLALLPDTDVSFGLNAAENPRSRLSMELYKVHQALQASQARHGNPSVLVIAADDEDDTVAVSLMLAAVAATTQRVLLIDADLDRRTLAAVDGDQSDAGLIDVAVGRRDLRDVIVRDHETNINMVPFVSTGSRRGRRINEADIKQAFVQAKRFDMVIVAAVDLDHDPSTQFFAGLVDHIILVARADGRNDRAVERFVARLGSDARKIRGAVLTGAEMT